jgi:hypothetical protein
MKPSDRESVMSRQPMPLGEEMTGTRRRWASSVSSFPASESVTP